MELQQLKNKLQRSIGARDQVQSRLNEIEHTQDHHNSRKRAIEKVQALIQTTAKETQEKLRYHIEDIVNAALDTCFPGEYDFIVDFQIKRGRTEAELYLSKDGERIDPMEASGGGVVDITSFALRLSCWSLSQTDNVIVLDEPAKWLSKNLRPLFSEILMSMSKRLKVQFIMATHDTEFIDCADRVFTVRIKKGRSQVEVK